MESFHIIVLVVASVSLILVLTIAGLLIKKDNGSQKFPTSHKDVPDGWEKTDVKSDAGVVTTLSHSGVEKKNPDGVSYSTKQYNYTNPTREGTATDPTPAVADKEFTGAVWKDICEKKKWADQNQVYWDGITTYNGC